MGSISSVLAQKTLTVTTNTDLYTVPLGYTVTIDTITLARTTTVAGTFPKVNIAIRPNGETLASKHYIVYAYSVSNVNYEILSVKLPLGPGDVVTAYADQSDCTVNLYGTEESL